MNYYSNELKSEISECYVNGASIDDLEKQFKLDRPILRYILKKTGVYKKTKSLHIWTEEEMDLLKTYYSIYDFNTIFGFALKFPFLQTDFFGVFTKNSVVIFLVKG